MRCLLVLGIAGALLSGAAPAAASGIGDRLDLTAPTASIQALPTFSAATSLTVGYAGADKESGVKNFDVRYRVARWRGAFGDYVQPANWQARTARSLTFAVSPGSDYCVSVRSRDNNDNVSAWTADACSAVALDDRALTAKGTWRRVADRSSYLGTLTRSSTFRSTLSVAAHGKRMALVVTTCPTCGQLAIVLDGQLWRTVDTRSSKVARRVVLVQPGGAFVVDTTITLGVAQARPVYVDGIAVTSR